MDGRRHFIKRIGAYILAALLANPLLSSVRRAWAKAAKTILPKGTDPQSLKLRNPAELDARNLELMNIDAFGTMGLSDYKADLKLWRLEVDGAVRTPLQLTYAEILRSPDVEKDVLLICPGVFVNYGHWKGVTIRFLLEKAGWDRKASGVIVRGPKSGYEKVENFDIGEITAEKLFLAYEVNGIPLPRKHGFPLRLVAENHYGFQWVKYVTRITVQP